MTQAQDEEREWVDVEVFIGKQVFEPLPRAFKVHGQGAERVLQLELVPPTYEDAREWFLAGANEYEVQVCVDATGRVSEVYCLVDQHPHARQSFTPNGAPAWLFGAGARFGLEWDDVAEGAQDLIIYWLVEATTPPGERAGHDQSR
jgi:hypothetical protein